MDKNAALSRIDWLVGEIERIHAENNGSHWWVKIGEVTAEYNTVKNAFIISLRGARWVVKCRISDIIDGEVKNMLPNWMAFKRDMYRYLCNDKR